MQLRSAGAFILSAALSLTLPTATLAQSTDSGAKQDMKAAGHDTSNAAKNAGSGVKQGTKKAYHKTAHATKKATHKVEGKKDTPVNNPPQ